MSSSPNPRQTVEQLGLQDKELIQLYLELIRIIEKDIDEIEAGDTRSGWTSWAIIGGIVASIVLFLGEMRKLTLFPTQDVKAIGLAGLLLYLVATFCINAFRITVPDVRPGRLRWSNEAFFSNIPRVVFRFLIFSTSILVALSLTLQSAPKTIIALTFGLLTLWTILTLIYSKLKFPLGNTTTTRKAGYGTFFITLGLCLVALILLGIQLPIPVGEAATLPYLLAGLILAVIILIDSLISMLSPSRLLSNLKELRNDIVFLRIDIDEALRRYELLTEGETLPDALQKDLSEIANDLILSRMLSST